MKGFRGWGRGASGFDGPNVFDCVSFGIEFWGEA